jgi:oxygen-independent coproporphyrinogen III oxidase
MAGIYIHIPFCKQACTYCNFHFSTSLQLKNDFLQALLKETSDRKDYLQGESIETIYFGGGSPSLLTPSEIENILNTIHSHFSIGTSPEITLEANPDDITTEKASNWKKQGINRISLGIQSFYDEDLHWMNRAHTAAQSLHSIDAVISAGFSNLTIDLIYGTPMLTDEKWKSNVERAIQYGVPHVSCYALTVEPKTLLEKMIRTGKIIDVNTDDQARQFLLLVDWLEGSGYEHYEISNFAKPGMRSCHNTSYWQQKKYLGVGPSAHSFNGHSRQWNISNNALYISSIKNSLPAFEVEQLEPIHRLNEYIMTSLRTSEGLNLEFVSSEFGGNTMNQLQENSFRHQQNGSIINEENMIRLTRKGKLLADGIAADLFFDKL